MAKKKTTPSASPRTYAEMIAAAVRAVKEDAAEEGTKDWDEGDWYGQLESEIDACLHEPEWTHLCPGYDDYDTDRAKAELFLERAVFDGVLKATRRRHNCDPRA